MIKVGDKSNTNNQNLDLSLSNKENDGNNDLFANIFSNQSIVTPDEKEKNINFNPETISNNTTSLKSETESNNLLKNFNLVLFAEASKKLVNNENDIDLSNDDEIETDSQNEIINPITAISNIKSEKETFGNNKEIKNKIDNAFSSDDIEELNDSEINEELIADTNNSKTQTYFNDDRSSNVALTNNKIEPKTIFSSDMPKKSELSSPNLNLQNSSSNGQEKNFTSPEKISLNQSIENIEGTDKRKESIDIKTSKINNNEFNEIKDKDISLNKENKKDSKVKIYDAKEIVNNKNEISSPKESEIFLSSSLKNDLKLHHSKIQKPNHSIEISTNNSSNSTSSNLNQHQSNNFSSQNQSNNIQTINEIKEMLDLADKKWTETLISKINKTKSDKKNELEIMLKPKHLGKMKVKISILDDKTMISIKTENQAAASLISEQESRLNQMFENAGLRLGNLNSENFSHGNNNKDNHEANNKKSMNEKNKSLTEKISDKGLDEKKLNNNDLLNIEV